MRLRLLVLAGGHLLHCQRSGGCFLSLPPHCACAANLHGLQQAAVARLQPQLSCPPPAVAQLRHGPVLLCACRILASCSRVLSTWTGSRRASTCRWLARSTAQHKLTSCGGSWRAWRRQACLPQQASQHSQLAPAGPSCWAGKRCHPHCVRPLDSVNFCLPSRLLQPQLFNLS